MAGRVVFGFEGVEYERDFDDPESLQRGQLVFVSLAPGREPQFFASAVDGVEFC